MALWTLAPPQQAMVADAGLSSWASSRPQTKTLTADSTSHTKGAYTEIDASTLAEWAGFTFTLSASQSATGTDTSTLMDIAVGAAGSEVVVLENLPVGYNDYRMTVDVPLRIPAGVRVAGRIQGAVSSDTTGGAFIPWAGSGFTGARSYQSAVTYGADTSTSRGVTVTADTGTNDTFGSWAVIAASTSAPIQAMLVGVQMNGDSDIGITPWRLEVGFGASSSEVTIATLQQNANSSEQVTFGTAAGRTFGTPPQLLTTTVGIPEGARLVARLATGLSTTTTPAVDVVIIGLR